MIFGGATVFQLCIHWLRTVTELSATILLYISSLPENNIIHYGLKSWVFAEVNDLWTTESNTLNAKKNIFKKILVHNTYNCSL